jgi:hypothetical protein
MAASSKRACKEANEMFTTKIRTAIIGLVATSSFGAAALSPAVSQAQWHTYCVAGHCITHQNFTIGGKEPCEAIKNNYNNAYDGLLGAIEPRAILVNGPSASQVEQERSHQIEEEEARVGEAERAAFEWGCPIAARTAPTSVVKPTASATPLRAL